MKHLFWMVEGVLAGRCGPCCQPWDPGELKENGIGAVVSLSDDAGDTEALANAGIAHLHRPITRNVPPLEQDVVLASQTIREALTWVMEMEDAQIPVLVHCALGNDRTGLLMAAYLMARGAAPVHAVSQVRSLREQAFTAEGWDQLVYDVLYSMQNESN